MRKVQLTPWFWVAAGVLVLLAIGASAPLSPAGWAAALGYLIVSSVLVSRGLRRRGSTRFGAANAVTATRSMLVGIATGLVATSLTDRISPALLVAIVAVALALDGVDGYVARRTGSVSELGARFDMEVDAFLLLVLSVYDVRFVGGWVLALGLMRYAFVAAAWVLPFLGRPLPFRYWRKVVAAACGIVLAVIAAQVLPPIAAVIAAAGALLLLLESFGRDVLWAVRMNRADARLVSPQKASARDGSR
ncbi:CDP-alcohol phosphatidyltransferase family protein [Microbacterium sp. 13-71-7]|jgi:phosphatidylglycerophosphate synthase|uniref:CDP-alcohol phosphatidyltransferase family protein n=1 Tax=Microbacterium sp. 13-71-7 TaxID=1970399 RepID=UPI000BDC8D0C|nr:CDP-alcohol phosphatidyltransferase family protein [Microbacterium sp. 13-71-7]OZB84367.1 MAG: CDP-alcohol phosphatidyltransferase [Microbacterium sp. 13-71-7]